MVHTNDFGFLALAIFIFFLLCSVSPSTVCLFTTHKLNAHALCLLLHFWWMSSATYRPGIWTTVFSVFFSCSIWTQIFLKWCRGRRRKKKRSFSPMWTAPMARDIEHFKPDNGDHHVENYLSSLDNCLADLHRASQREKVKLVGKTSSKAVCKFIETQPPSVRDDYRQLCHALKEEFSSSADEATGTVAAIQVKHSHREHPRYFYIRFRHAYYQGRNAPGLEENPIFKSCLWITSNHVYAFMLKWAC